MPLIAQICMIVVTIAVVGLAIVAVRLLFQTRALIESATRSLAELPTLIAETRRASARVEELMVALGHITRSANSGVAQFEGVAHRAGTLAGALLDEVERPVAGAIGLVAGIRTGASFLIQRWRQRASSQFKTNQGDDHVAEQRWVDDGGVAAGSSSRGGAGPGPGPNGR